jgi:hypothetical protein
VQPEKIPYGIKRYHNETLRLYSVLEDQLSVRAFLVRSSDSPVNVVISGNRVDGPARHANISLALVKAKYVVRLGLLRNPLTPKRRTKYSWADMSTYVV